MAAGLTWEAAAALSARPAELALHPFAVVQTLSLGVAVARTFPHLSCKASSVSVHHGHQRLGQSGVFQLDIDYLPHSLIFMMRF